jgi:phosphoglycerate kinase
MMALDVGPKTIKKISFIFENIKILLWNGPLGAFELEPFGEGTFSLAKIASNLTISKKLITVAGGGDTSSALNKAGVSDKFTYISSAGGAFLEWLEGIELPAITVLSNNK